MVKKQVSELLKKTRAELEQLKAVEDSLEESRDRWMLIRQELDSLFKGLPEDADISGHKLIAFSTFTNDE